MLIPVITGYHLFMLWLVSMLCVSLINAKHEVIVICYVVVATDLVQQVNFSPFPFTIIHLASLSHHYTLMICCLGCLFFYWLKGLRGHSSIGLTTVRLVLPRWVVCGVQLSAYVFLCFLICQTVLLLMCSCLKCRLTTVAVVGISL